MRLDHVETRLLDLVLLVSKILSSRICLKFAVHRMLHLAAMIAGLLLAASSQVPEGAHFCAVVMQSTFKIERSKI